MTAHTPGPWHRNIKPATKYGTIFAREAPRHTHVCHLAVTGLPPEEVEANCSLIVAAPDLLDTLRDVVEYAERFADLNDEPAGGGCRRSIAAARAAIAKAEGCT